MQLIRRSAGRRLRAFGGVLITTLGLTATAATPATAAANACLTGTLAFDHYDAEAGTSKPLRTQVARNANWELWGRTGSGTATRLAAGITGASDGRFTACHTTSLAEAYARFRSSSTSMWRVVKAANDTTDYAFDSARRTNVSGPVDLGTVKVPSTLQRAWKVVDTLNVLYWKRANPVSSCWTARQSDGRCDRITFVWDPKVADGGYWDYPNTNYVFLGASMPDSKHLILHEAGHWLQWQLYGRDFPVVDNCNPHYVEKHSSESCAWTEGFADAVAAYALGDYRYVRDDGTSVSFENDGPTPGWDDGDTVQGRVGSSLLDLWVPDGPDGGNWDRTIALMTRHFSQDFREYFTVGRPAVGLSTTGAAERILAGHTIWY
ncbi:metalloprotease [Amycolatopsis roodepoortensis]|uniref:metalloprotease n=1 Tax=Amycolatopsis roodepoortensis TaxID=700274 RepID=UPI00214A955C|nr:metalloprotease [Amycolatopsis roodepoortensis]UUV32717.1 metalloprotease [Amycolatopsis roodepoortensis]